MRPGTLGFVGIRLKEAREARGITQTSLAQLLNISKSMVSNYENNNGTPNPEILQSISNTLNMPVQYFLNPNINEELQSPLFFRSMSATTLSARNSAEQRHKWLKTMVEYLNEYVTFPNPNIPDFGFKSGINEISEQDIEEAASEARKFFNLGDGPISNVVYLLENNGAIVSRIGLNADSLDAFSNWEPTIRFPFVVLNSAKECCVRSRFDAAHELGHLILHRNISKEIVRRTPEFKQMEAQAHRFAGAFLMPAETFADVFWPHTLDVMLTLKSHWKTSISSMIMRARHLDLIDKDYETKLWRFYARRGYKKNEPLDDTLVPEKPILLGQALELVLREGIKTKNQILSDLSISRLDIEEFAGLPNGYFDDTPQVMAKVVPFRKPVK